jgi:hypothetical protein
MSMKISVLVIVCTAFALATGFADPVAAASVSGGHNIGAIYFTCHSDGAGSGSLTEATPGCADYLAAGSFTLTGSGQATYSTLRASASVGFSGIDPSGSVGTLLADALGQAQYQDTLTIDIAGRTGETVDLVFTTAINGTTSASSSDSSTTALASGNLNVWVNGQRVAVSQRRPSTAVPEFFNGNPGLVQIVLGTPFSVSAQLTVRAQLFPSTPVNGRYYSGEASANFSNSAGITSFALNEAGGGAPITDWNLTSQSGEFGFYTVVPVPASVWLFGSGLLGLVGMARPKKAA